jgi:hypothetical protein
LSNGTQLSASRFNQEEEFTTNWKSWQCGRQVGQGSRAVDLLPAPKGLVQVTFWSTQQQQQQQQQQQ